MGVYDAASGKLYLLRGNANKVAVIDAQLGATLSQFATPAGVDYWNGGLALGPSRTPCGWARRRRPWSRG